MTKILFYSFYDLIRGRWTYIYTLFYFVLGYVLLFLNSDISKAIMTLVNVIIILTPLIGTLFGVMYYYNSRDFTELLLAQPIKRSNIFLGQYFGVAISLSLSLVIGLLIPFSIFGLFSSEAIIYFVNLLLIGTALTFIFVAFAYNVALKYDDKIKGFGAAILTWLFFAIIYDGLFLASLVIFDEYPIDKFALVASILNPIDLSRILILLKLDISALLGYTGAVFQRFFGTNLGIITATLVLLMWICIPIWIIAYKSNKRDF